LKNAARPQTKLCFNGLNDVLENEINRFVSHLSRDVVIGLLSLFLPWHFVSYYRAALRRSADAIYRANRMRHSQAKPPAPPRLLNDLQSQVGQAFSLPDFCHGLPGASEWAG